MKPTITKTQLVSELKQAYAKKRDKNPRFSLRSFAKSMGVNESTLQKIMKGQRQIGRQMAVSFADKLGFTFVGSPGDFYKRKPASKNRRLKSIDVDVFPRPLVAISILELTTLVGFQADAEWLAKKLDYSLSDISANLDFLLNKQFLVQENGQWVDRLDIASSRASGLITSEILRSMQIEMNEISKQKIISTPVEYRDHVYTIVPVFKANLEKIKEKIAAHRREITRIIETDLSQERDALYVIQVNLFPISKI